MTVIRLIDVEHFLHRLAGQVDFLADHFGAVSLFHLDQRKLDSVRLRRLDFWIFFRERPEHGFFTLGPIELLRFLPDLFLG